MSSASIIISALLGLGIISHSIALLYKYRDNNEKTRSVCKYKIYFRILGDIFIACFIISFCFISMRIPIDYLHEVISKKEQIGLVEIRRISGLFFISFIICFGAGGAFAGLLSVFQSNLTQFKRTILLIISFLPLVFTILYFIISPFNNIYSLIKLGFLYSGICWIVNGPSILFGRHWFELGPILFDKIHRNRNKSV